MTSPYLTTDEAAAYLRYASVQAFRRIVRRRGIPHIRRGRRLIFTQAHLDEWMAVVTEATRPRRRVAR
jgi:excisionase family DNA binding protein